MSKVIIEESSLQDIADSIRDKNGSNSLYKPSEMAQAIEDIPTGGSGQENDIIDRSISMYTNNTISSIGEYAFAGCQSLTTVSFPQCTNITARAFSGCSSLTDISFPQCTTIGNYAFSGCTSLTTVSFPVCTTMGSYAFNKCSSLTTALFPACTNIATAAFYTCTSLRTASFPACTDIGGNAFNSCYKLLSLYLLGNSVPTLSNINAFTSTPISNYTTSTSGVRGSIIVQPSMMNAFKSATNWSVYSSRFSAWNGTD